MRPPIMQRVYPLASTVLKKSSSFSIDKNDLHLLVNAPLPTVSHDRPDRGLDRADRAAASSPEDSAEDSLAKFCSAGARAKPCRPRSRMFFPRHVVVALPLLALSTTRIVHGELRGPVQTGSKKAQKTPISAP